jgi:hypothetical protein
MSPREENDLLYLLNKGVFWHGTGIIVVNIKNFAGLSGGEAEFLR